MNNAAKRAKQKYELKRKESMTTVRLSKELRNIWKEAATQQNCTMVNLLENYLKKHFTDQKLKLSIGNENLEKHSTI